jgi:hypothetical protein
MVKLTVVPVIPLALSEAMKTAIAVRSSPPDVASVLSPEPHRGELADPGWSV